MESIYKGDTIEWEGTLGENITSWKIRAELFDNNISIKKATINVIGGSDTQIKITDAINGVFSIFIDKGQTTDISNSNTTLEIEAETNDGKNYTVYREKIFFNNEKITWDSI